MFFAGRYHVSIQRLYDYKCLRGFGCTSATLFPFKDCTITSKKCGHFIGKKYTVSIQRLYDYKQKVWAFHRQKIHCFHSKIVRLQVIKAIKLRSVNRFPFKDCTITSPQLLLQNKGFICVSIQRLYDYKFIYKSATNAKYHSFHSKIVRLQVCRREFEDCRFICFHSKIVRLQDPI